MPASPTMSTWVWAYEDPVWLVRFAVEQGIERLYLHVDQTHGAALARLHRLRGLADAAGIELWAMSGDPSWVFMHEHAVTWQRSALGTGLFAGTHLDVEPYAQDAWDADRGRVIAEFVALLARLSRADERPLHVAVPFWYHEHPGPGRTGDTLADAVLDVADAVTVMSYRDFATGPNSLSVIAADMLTRAAAASVPIELAVETNQVPDHPHTTFYQEGAVAMRAVINTMNTFLADHPTYIGFAVHDVAGFRALVER